MIRVMPENNQNVSQGAENRQETAIYYCSICGYNDRKVICCPSCGTMLGNKPFERTIIESLSGCHRREE